MVTEKRSIQEGGYQLDELRERYKLLSKRCHPDKVGKESMMIATEAQKWINIAYKTIADKTKQGQ